MIQIADIILKNNALLAPMSGVTDAPFRRLAHELGAGLVISEMVASEELAKANVETLRKAEGGDYLKPFVIQLAGREEKWMAQGAKIAEDMGADIIDINMGCPARKVISGMSGSALMRDPDHALRLIEATVAATSKPVTLKMRLGWDFDMLNAPEIGYRAEQAGVQMLTIHGRTRNQFYKGNADWAKIADTAKRVKIPVVANGDLNDIKNADKMMKLAGAQGVMVGRAAYGMPWFVGDVGQYLSDKTLPKAKSLRWQHELVLKHFEMMLAHYGEFMGLRIARKHLGWYLENIVIDKNDLKPWRIKIFSQDESTEVRAQISAFFTEQMAKQSAFEPTLSAAMNE
ncbi:MAG: tRNA dihydrouridine synthase DusB [Alphaproteobacteria bacterium]|nr:tRNA dihydrouridine synthase DusB [Alphaproteobacteria bacterium]